MLKKLAYAGAFTGAVAAVTAIGCGGNSGTTRPFDFAVKNTNTDGGGGDAHVESYFATNPHDVDTATISDPNGLATVSTPISMTGLIVLASPSGFSAKVTTTGDGCRYEVWAQDPTCTTPPCGILLETQAILNPNGTGKFCPYADELDDAKNVLKNTRQGDVVTVTGQVDNFPKSEVTDAGTTFSVTAHEVELDSLTTTKQNGELPTPTPVKDTAVSLFTPYSGSGWKTYEGMYITLTPPDGTAVFTSTLNTSSSFTDTCPGVTGKTNGSFTLAPTGAYFADTYASFYIPKEAGDLTNCYPLNGSTFTSVSGIVSASFGGSILPASVSDLQPAP